MESPEARLTSTNEPRRIDISNTDGSDESLIQLLEDAIQAIKENPGSLAAEQGQRLESIITKVDGTSPLDLVHRS